MVLARLALLCGLLACCASAVAGSPPNVLLIVADDLGYSDIGAYGGEIETPNIDALARNGVQLTQFYAAPMCSPTRAMLLTGVDHHQAGVGNLAERLSENQRGQPGYEGQLNDRVVTLAEILSASGYNAYLAGKWHLGRGQADPSARGFSRYFALMESGAGHFSNMLPLLGPGIAEYRANGTDLDALPEGFYSSTFYVDKVIDYIEQDRDSGKPFFAYLSFTAPHFPLQARRETIDKYRGRYDKGFQETLDARLARMQSLGLVPQGASGFPRLESQKPWDALTPSKQAESARIMEIYAAMVDDMDQEIGRLLSYLEQNGQRDNTLIIFISDNGAEGHYLEWGLDPLVPWAESCCNNSIENLGNADSYIMLGPDWARVSATPLRMFKGFTSDGGIRVPALISMPGVVSGGRRTEAVATVRDVVPTILDLAGIETIPETVSGQQPVPIQGRSLLPLLRGTADSAHPPGTTFAWEMFGKRALRQGPWKIIHETTDATWWNASPQGISRTGWQLYNLEDDPAELVDRSAGEPERFQSMIDAWDAWARDSGVILPDKQRGY